MTRDEQAAMLAREYAQVLRKLDRIVDSLEAMGESDMGMLKEHHAERFHYLTDEFRKLLRSMASDGHSALLVR